MCYLRERLQKFRDNRLALQNKDKEFHGYTVGQIVYMYHPRGSLLQTASKKIKCEFVGPLAIYKCVSPNQFLLMSLDGYLYPFLVEETRIKPGFIPTTRGNVNHLAELKKIIRTRFQSKVFRRWVIITYCRELMEPKDAKPHSGKHLC